VRWAEAAIVFQGALHALNPVQSIGDQIAEPIRLHKTAKDVNARVAELLQQVGLPASRAKSYPHQLSGGQRQRVALGRAMVRRPDVFLMDEPLSNLDAKLRVHMRAELSDLHKRLGVTFIYVTHDQIEAMTMASRVALMDEGRILQLGTPQELYHDPADLRVARFIGSPPVNVFQGKALAHGVELAGAHLPIEPMRAAGTPLQVAIRPEALTLGAHAGRPVLYAKIAHVENLGAEVFLHFHPLAGSALPVILRAALETYELHKHGFAGEVALSIDPSRVMLFDETGMRLKPAVRAVPAIESRRPATAEAA